MGRQRAVEPDGLPRTMPPMIACAPQTRRLAPLLALLVALPALLSTPPAEAAKKRSKYVSEAWIHNEGSEDLRSRFHKELAKAKRAKREVVVFFTADWCSPCKAFKELLDYEPVVQKAAQRGHIVYIDVDDWRGPAHHLIEGAYPDKLPLLVRVDAWGKRVTSCFGSELGLLSPEMVAKNLARFIDANTLLPPDYDKDPKLRSRLVREQADKRKARAPKTPTVGIETRFKARGQWMVKLSLHNHEARRAWFAIPRRIGASIPTGAQTNGYERTKFAEHVRANFYRVLADPIYDLIPVAGEGVVEIDQWRLEGPPDATSITILELRRWKVDGQVTQYDKKVPYELHIDNGSALNVYEQRSVPLKVELEVLKRHEVGLR